MNLNPFELVKNEYSIEEMYVDDKYNINVNKDIYDKVVGDGEYDGDYLYLIKSINTNIDWTIFVDRMDYQGDLMLFGEYNGKYYFLTYGYGSCSGCDAYYAEEGSINGLTDLRESIKREIKEFDSLGDFVFWFNEKDGRDYWYFDGCAMKCFKEKFEERYYGYFLDIEDLT